ncbi:SMP-30/gluconolactonase/LRE family protein [Streptomyces sp. URMC 123]|uniref:SMP-30/gluconolactonase/LRE family protein n=1 Tax=Streptomyces sp. URMC 123 TaxID=3423403 RepID=UPI003F1CDEB5
MKRHVSPVTRRGVLAAGAALGGAAVLGPLAGGARASSGARRERKPWPTTLALPDGFRPEGIAIGSGPYAYLGSLGDGTIYRADLATGRGAPIGEGPGKPAVGLKIDRRGRLFIGGGSSREARVVDSRTGRVLATYPLGNAATMVNDVILTPRAAYVTDSFNPWLFVLPLGPYGRLPEPRDIVTLPLTGEWTQGPAFTANGIARTPDGRALLVTNAPSGALFRVDPRTGDARAVPHTGPRLVDADGLLRLGRTLYVVQQRQNAVDVLRLDAAGTRAEAITRITDPRFAIPTTAAAFGNRLYLPNARFDVDPPLPTTPYTVVAVPLVRGD